MTSQPVRDAARAALVGARKRRGRSPLGGCGGLSPSLCLPAATRRAPWRRGALALCESTSCATELHAGCRASRAGVPWRDALARLWPGRGRDHPRGPPRGARSAPYAEAARISLFLTCARLVSPSPCPRRRGCAPFAPPRRRTGRMVSLGKVMVPKPVNTASERCGEGASAQTRTWRVRAHGPPAQLRPLPRRARCWVAAAPLAVLPASQCCGAWRAWGDGGARRRCAPGGGKALVG